MGDLGGGGMISVFWDGGGGGGFTQVPPPFFFFFQIDLCVSPHLGVLGVEEVLVGPRQAQLPPVVAHVEDLDL